MGRLEWTVGRAIFLFIWLAPQGGRQRLEPEMEQRQGGELVSRLRDDAAETGSTATRGQAPGLYGADRRRWIPDWRVDAPHPEADQHDPEGGCPHKEERQREGGGIWEVGELPRRPQTVVHQGTNQGPRAAPTDQRGGKRAPGDQSECTGCTAGSLCQQPVARRHWCRAAGIHQCRVGQIDFHTRRPHGRAAKLLGSGNSERWCGEGQGKETDDVSPGATGRGSGSSCHSGKAPQDSKKHYATAHLDSPSTVASPSRWRECAVWGGECQQRPLHDLADTPWPYSCHPIGQAATQVGRDEAQHQAARPCTLAAQDFEDESRREVTRKTGRSSRGNQRDCGHRRGHADRKSAEIPPRGWVAGSGDPWHWAWEHMLCHSSGAQAMPSRAYQAEWCSGLFRCVPLGFDYEQCGFFGQSATSAATRRSHEHIRLLNQSFCDRGVDHRDGVKQGASHDPWWARQNALTRRYNQESGYGSFFGESASTPSGWDGSQWGHDPFWARPYDGLRQHSFLGMQAGDARSAEADPRSILAHWPLGTSLLDFVLVWRMYFWCRRWDILEALAASFEQCSAALNGITFLCLCGCLWRSSKGHHRGTHIRGVRKTMPRYFSVVLAFATMGVGETAPTNGNTPSDQQWRRPESIEIWRSGMSTIAEQLQQAHQRMIQELPLERLSREAPEPAFMVPWRPDVAVMEDEGPTTHITVWVAAPFYVAESLDLAVHFPLTADRLEDIVRWALRILPETMEELVPTTPQLHDDFASYILCPSWLADVDKYCMVLDCIDIGGPAFAIYHEGPLTKRNILEQVPTDDVSNLEAFLFGQLNPLCEGDRRQPVMGGVIKILRRGAVCDWAVTELAPRFMDTTAWRPATDLPHPASGYHVVYQGVDDQVICEGYVPDPGGHEQRGARELELEGPCWALIPGEPPENLSHGGKIVLAPIAILQESEFDREEVTIIFLDLRQISFFPQWMALRGDPVLDPAAYLEGIQFPTVRS